MIFSIGLPKTGTSSLKRASVILGYKKGKVRDLFNDIDAFYTGDFMCLPLDLYKKLDEMYPEAKFILTLRKNEEVWYNSVYNWSQKRIGNKGLLKQRKRMYGHEMPNPDNKNDFKAVYLSRFIGITYYFTGKYKDDYSKKLLLFCPELGDGWDELCSFLSVPVPDIDYPKVNVNKKKIWDKD